MLSAWRTQQSKEWTTSHKPFDTLSMNGRITRFIQQTKHSFPLQRPTNHYSVMGIGQSDQQGSTKNDDKATSFKNVTVVNRTKQYLYDPQKEMYRCREWSHKNASIMF
eukprot:1017799_1